MVRVHRVCSHKTRFARTQDQPQGKTSRRERHPMSVAMPMPAEAAAAPAKSSPPLYKSLFVQVLVALILGFVLGMATPDFASGLKVLSDGFLKLISMIVAPIVF